MSVKNNRRELIGVVKSDKMDKTVTVAVERKVKHPFFGKYVKRTTKVMAHDEKNECKPGYTVRLKETKPVSKNKSWLVVEILKKTIGEDIAIVGEEEAGGKKEKVQAAEAVEPAEAPDNTENV